jgi:hypothetical protein
VTQKEGKGVYGTIKKYRREIRELYVTVLEVDLREHDCKNEKSVHLSDFFFTANNNTLEFAKRVFELDSIIKL